MKQDISAIKDIQTLVDSFYTEVRKDEYLGPVFHSKVGDRWPEHLEKMYRFWQTILLNERTYAGRPFPPHARLPIEQRHFDRWLSLFHATVDALFSGEKADEAKWRASKMAELFALKLQHFRDRGIQPLI